MPETSRPVFSVITVTYNAEAVIERTIQSVLSQYDSYANIEYLIIDGASKDDTMNIVHRYADNISQIISEPDKGLYDAMNKGIAMATGDYLCFLNAGDCFHADNTLYRIADNIDNSPMPDIIYGETAIVDNDHEFLHLRRLRAPEVLTWKSFKNGMLVCHQSFYVRRQLADPYDNQYRFSADFDWCIRMMKKSAKLHNTHLILVDYLDEGMTTENRKASLIERFKIMTHHYGLCSTVIRHIKFVFRLLFLRSK